jgi:sec-independent protein translocase protein TatA
MLGLFGGLGPTEILVILLIVLLLFGAKRIPEVAQGLGKGLKEFKKAAKDIQKDIDQAGEEEKKPKQ